MAKNKECYEELVMPGPEFNPDWCGDTTTYNRLR
jgi:hypothetical protein